MKILIQNGTLVTGEQASPFEGDLCIKDGIIHKLGGVQNQAADLVIDAKGMLVTPGFIDVHRHPDLAAFGEGFGRLELAQGITTIVGGNCGLSPVPMCLKHAQTARDFLAPCLGTADTPVFERFGDYIQALRKRSLPLNMGMLTAVGAIKTCVKGFQKSPFTDAQMDVAQGLLRDALTDGALGVSLGLMYPPECYSTKEETIRLLSAATPYGRPLCCHIRGEGASLLNSVDEVLTLAQAVELPLHISHFKSTGLHNWRRLIYEAIERIERARSRGCDVTVDFYPYEAGASTLLSLVPPAALMDDQQAFLRTVNTAGSKARMRQLMSQERPGWDNMALDIGWERIILSSAEGMEDFSGLNFCEVAMKLGLSDPCDAMCEVLSVTRGNAGVVLMSMCPEDVETVAQLPYSLLISDALYGGGAAHPRQKGAFPHFLRQYVPKTLSMSEAIRKMTSMPADLLGLSKRGRLKEGYHADVAVFDPDRFTDKATYAKPDQIAQGMEMLIVNGAPVWRDRSLITPDAGRLMLATQQTRGKVE